MKIPIKINGKEVIAEINDADLVGIFEPEEPWCYGFEDVEENKKYWYETTTGELMEATSNGVDAWENMRYNCGNYYSDEAIALNNARADNLLRVIRQFCALNELIYPYVLPKYGVKGCHITYDPDDTYYERDGLGITFDGESTASLGGFTFKTERDAQMVIDEFHDELLWYFMKYRIYNDPADERE